MYSQNTSILATYIIALNVADPCEDTVLSLTSVLADPMTVFTGTTEVLNLQISDTASSTYGSGDGVTYCGSRTVEKINVSTFTWLSTSGTAVTIAPSLSEQVDVINKVELRAFLDNY